LGGVCAAAKGRANALPSASARPVMPAEFWPERFSCGSGRSGPEDFSDLRPQWPQDCWANPKKLAPAGHWPPAGNGEIRWGTAQSGLGTTTGARSNEKGKTATFAATHTPAPLSPPRWNQETVWTAAGFGADVGWLNWAQQW